MNMKKAMIMLLASAIAVASLTACGGNGGDESSVPESSVQESSVQESAEPSKAEADMAALLGTVKAGFSTQDVRELAAEDIFNDTGIATDSYSEYFWLSEISGLSSEKAVVYHAKDEATATDIEAKLNTVLQSELAQMKDYNADNYAMLQKAVLQRKGLYVYLLVSPNVDALQEAVSSAL